MPYNEEKIFQQNLNEKAPQPGTVFFIHLLFEEKCEIPQQTEINKIMERHLGKTECFSYDKASASFIPKNYIAHFKDADVNTGEYAAESGDKLFTHIPYYKKQFTFIG